MKRLLFSLLLGLGLAWGQFPITESFMNSTAPGWVIGGNAYLTSGNGDPTGQGWLRLTRNTNNQKGYAYYNTAFPSTLGVRIEFDFLAWGGSGGNRGADGISVFLFDGATTTFTIGDFGGALGYCQGYGGSPGGLSNAYVGIAFDEWGNFSNPADRCPNGGPGQRPDSVAIRGPGNGSTGYAYLTGTGNRLGGTPLSGTSIDYETAASIRPSPSAYYRRARVDLVPVGGTYQITVYLATSPSGPFTQILGPYTMPSPPPPTLKIGFAGSTGGATNYHEIRNLSVNALTAPADLRVTKTGPATATPGGSITYTVTVQNVGPNPLSGASFSDTVPAGITGVSWTCTGTGGASCQSASGSGNAISTTLNLPLNSSVTFTITGTVSPSAAGQTLTNTASAFPPAGYTDTNPADNTASVTTQVVAYTLSGRVYHDLQPNGLREPSEDWSSGTLVYVNLVQGGSVVQSAAVNPGTGSFSLTGVASGSYTLVVATTSTATAPQAPPGWRFIHPATGSLALDVSSDRSDLLFGLFQGFLVQGRVFRDDGLLGGIGGDAWQNGGERGIAGVEVRATNGTETRTALTDGNGDYRIYIPGSWTSVTLSHPLRPATGWNDGSAAYPVSSFAQAASSTSSGATASLGSLSSDRTVNFGVAWDGRLRPDGSGQTTSPGTLTFAHTYTPGNQGTVTLSLANTPRYTYQVRLDLNCDGDFQDAGEGWQSLPYVFSVGPSWPREPDGSFRTCGLEVLALVPPGEAAGAVDLALVQAELAWEGNPSVKEPDTVTDTLQVAGGEVRLSKRARNVTQNTPFGTTAQGRPGDVLEYCIAYRNLGTLPVTQFVLTDPVPFFTDPLLSVADYGGRAIQWTHGGSPSYLTANSGDDAGEIASGIVRVTVGTLGPGEEGEVCYRVQVR
ncbi:lectin-like domain-containing protein [Thermus filiformis]|uniref:lectin-like domain-containing protein n=1 Tax=Thermus filiformis TaxID=276 RepID=UPI0005321C1F|nr:DUF11 domain-containing protein [Thermus filiformis]